MTHWAAVGLLRLVGVVVQGDEVVAELHLVAAPAEHVLSALALTRVGVAAAGTEAVSTYCLEATSHLIFLPLSCLQVLN